MGNFGYNPLEVDEVIKDAYRIRSLFSHGSHLGYEERKKFEREYKGIKNLLMTILDYLRISIIAHITLHFGKDDIIDIIDESFLDRKRDEQLTSLLNVARNILSSD